MEYKIIALKIENREKDASEVQKILTDFGCNIKMRLGLHNTAENSCSPSGLILMEIVAKDNEINEFIKKLNSFSNVTAKLLVI